jgi:putative transposase
VRLAIATEPPWVRAELLEQGHPARRERVAGLVRLACIRGISRRRELLVTTQRDPRQRLAPELVNRKFAAIARTNSGWPT